MRAVSLGLLAILLAALAVRIPYLANATPHFNADEAANALQLKHLVERREFSLHPWDATYYGIVEELISVPYVAVLGFEPLAFKLAAMTGHLLLIVFTFLLGRRLFGPAEGLAAACLLAFFSPRALLWSGFATGGVVLIAAWGTLTFLWLDRLRRQPSWRNVAVLGLMAGFGLYIYELYLVNLAVLAIAAAVASFAWKAMLAESPEGRRAALRKAPRQLGMAALFLTGFAIGWLPKILAITSGDLGGKAPAYALAGPEKMADNLELLVSVCIPAFFGVNPAGREELEQWVGRNWPLSPLLGSLLLAAWAAAWLWGGVRNRNELAGVVRRPPGTLGTESLLVLLVPVTALLFVISPNARDLQSDHYLLPWLSSLPLFAGAMLVRLWRRARVPALLLGLLLTAFPLAQIVTCYQWGGDLDHRARIVRRREPLLDVLDDLRARGIRGGYSWYWAAYKATFLSQEEIVIAPLWDWDRYPAYTRHVDALPAAAYIFEYQRTPAGERLDERHTEFARRLRAAGSPHEVRRIGKFLVYTSPQGRRLFLPLRPLSRPRSAVEVLRVPPFVQPGEMMRVPVRLTNAGSEPWSAAGDDIGVYRVAFSYRWLKEDGTPVVLFDGRRTLLPADLYPGESVELAASIAAPSAPGDYRLVFSAVQEGVAWFMDAGGGSAELAVHVGAPAPAAAD